MVVTSKKGDDSGAEEEGLAPRDPVLNGDEKSFVILLTPEGKRIMMGALIQVFCVKKMAVF
jgi:hypothetical protein